VTKRLTALLFIVCICFLFQACTYKAWYEGFKEGQRQDCYKIEDPDERLDCLERVNSMTYEEYTRTRED
jgi:hypothetical protein